MSDNTTQNYAEQTATGTSWKRAVRIVVENPLGKAPTLMIVEEEALVFGDKTITNPIANLNVTMDLSNPLHVQAYEVLNAIYVEARELRDSPVIVEPVIPEPMPV